MRNVLLSYDLFNLAKKPTHLNEVITDDFYHLILVGLVNVNHLTCHFPVTHRVYKTNRIYNNIV